MRLIFSLFLAGVFCGVAISTLTAAEPATTTQPTTAEAPKTDLIQLSFPENVEVKLLVEYVSKRLGINIHYDTAVGNKRVTIISPTRIPKDSLIGLLQSVLKMAGLVMVDSDQPGWKEIVENRDLFQTTRQINPDQANLADKSANTAITQIFHLNHVLRC